MKSCPFSATYVFSRLLYLQTSFVSSSFKSKTQHWSNISNRPCCPTLWFVSAEILSIRLSFDLLDWSKGLLINQYWSKISLKMKFNVVYYILHEFRTYRTHVKYIIWILSSKLWWPFTTLSWLGDTRLKQLTTLSTFLFLRIKFVL